MKEESSKIDSIIPFLTAIPDLIKKISKQFYQQERWLFRTHMLQGLTPPQLFLLRQLWKQDGIQLKAIAEAAHSTRATITSLADTMEEDGYITRVPNPEDGRSQLVKLTQKGRDLQIYKTPIERDIDGCFKDFTPEELALFYNLLKKLSDSIEK
jgi:DNA-binding MarR family transcriptional regulator